LADAKNKNWRARLRHAFAVDDKPVEWSEEDSELIDRVARFIVDRGLSAPATLALESSRPYTFLGSQFLTFIKPFAHIALPGPDFERFTRLIENRSSIDLILDRLDNAERNA
jgi:hypothetical protein